MSRTDYSIKNLLVSSGGEILVIFLTFVTRTVFIHTLGTQYLGINGLFTNLLSMLSLAELGIGSAVTFDLYKPIANKDQRQIVLLMKFYGRVYKIIGFSIAGMGILLIPFLPYIIKDNVDFININFIFLIYLVQTVSSYLFFAYKSSLIKAHQREYIITTIGIVFSVITNMIQMLVLILLRHFEIYVLIVVLTNVIQNMAVAMQADKMFPYLKEKTKSVLSKEQRKKIYKNSYAAFFYKINSRVVNATDNILLSSFIGLDIVGVYSNYLLIFSTVKVFLNKFYSAILASLGDLHASANVQREYKIFKITNFFTVCAFGLAAIGIFVVGNEFISIWIGSDFTLSQVFVLLFALEIYIYGLEKNLSTFRTAMGLFQQAKYRPVFGMAINLGLSLLLINYIGIYGVIIGTIFSSLLTFMWFDPYIIYKYVFKRSVHEYYFTNFKYILFIFAAGSIAYNIAQLVRGEGFGYVMIHSGICVVVTCIFIVVIFYRTEEFQYLWKLAKRILSMIRQKKIVS